MKKVVLVIGILFLVVAILIFRPVPIPATLKKCEKVEGEVASIYEAGVKDVVFVLRDDDKRYYINRGLENGLNLDTLRQDLLTENISIYYPRYWTPLDWNNRVKHLSHLTFQEQVIYTEVGK